MVHLQKTSQEEYYQEYMCVQVEIETIWYNRKIQSTTCCYGASTER